MNYLMLHQFIEYLETLPETLLNEIVNTLEILRLAD